MAFVSVNHEYHGAAGLALRERQEIVYLPIPDTFDALPKRPAPTEDLEVNVAAPVSAAKRFRYSAITFNGHRSHYDLDYARNTENYPGLMIHGPLQAQILMDQAVAWKGRAPRSFRFRGVHPLFQGDDVSLRGVSEAPDMLDLCTVAVEGHKGMTATARWTV